MKRLLTGLLLMIAATTATAATTPFSWRDAKKEDCTFCVNPYIGGDIQWNTVKFNKGGNFGHQNPQTNVYGGFRLTDSVSAEVGTNRTHKSYSSYRNYHRFHSIYAGAVFNTPLAHTANCDAIGGVGYSRVKGTYRQLGTGLSTERAKFIPRLMGGAQYHITPQLNWRAAVIWENTRELEANHPAMGLIKPENTVTYSLGLNYTF